MTNRKQALIELAEVMERHGIKLGVDVGDSYEELLVSIGVLVYNFEGDIDHCTIRKLANETEEAD